LTTHPNPENDEWIARFKIAQRKSGLSVKLIAEICGMSVSSVYNNTTARNRHFPRWLML